MLTKIYNLLPNRFLERLRSQKKVLQIVNFIWPKKNGDFRESTVKIDKDYEVGRVNFRFVASINTARKAQTIGLETTLLNNVFKLISKHGLSKNNFTILDVGANFGYLSCVFACTISKEGMVYSFEPNPFVYQSLVKTVSLNPGFEKVIQMNNVAVGQNSCQVMLQLMGGTSNVIASEKSNRCITIEMISVDDYVNRIKLTKVDLIKIDVDGIELEILLGAKSLLQRDKPMLIVETNQDYRILDYCFDMGYRIYDMNLEELKIGYEITPHNIFCI